MVLFGESPWTEESGEPQSMGLHSYFTRYLKMKTSNNKGDIRSLDMKEITLHCGENIIYKEPSASKIF